MLQQTRVDQVGPYFSRFLDRFPDVDALSSAELDDVLKAWEGLGYYARARNLHRAAGVIAESGFPDGYNEWIELPGVGAYTAASISSIINGDRTPAIDGNVSRVVSRLFGVATVKGTTAFRQEIGLRALPLLDTERPGDVNEALMDLGATICTPRKPACTVCPVSDFCSAFIAGRAEAYPARPPPRPVPHHCDAAGLIAAPDGLMLVRQRPVDGLLGGLWEFPTVRLDEGEDAVDRIRESVEEAHDLTIAVGPVVATIGHAYSHFRVTIVAHWCRVIGNPYDAQKDPPTAWVDADGLEAIAMSRAHRRLASLAAGRLHAAASNVPSLDLR